MPQTISRMAVSTCSMRRGYDILTLNHDVFVSSCVPLAMRLTFCRPHYRTHLRTGSHHTNDLHFYGRRRLSPLRRVSPNRILTYPDNLISIPHHKPSVCSEQLLSVTICTQEETEVSVITLEDQAAQLKDCGTATTPQLRNCSVVSKYTLVQERVLTSERDQLANNQN